MTKDPVNPPHLSNPLITQRPRTVIAKWISRFSDAGKGLVFATKDQENMRVHFAFALVACGIAFWLDFELWRWCVLILCIALVISAELMNSAIERLVKTVHPDHDAGIADTLHMAAASVLVAAIGSVAIGALLFVPPFLEKIR